MHDDQVASQARNTADADRTVLEFLFILIVSLIVISAFVTASGYEFVSARTPVVIMVPLALLVALQLVRATKALRSAKFRRVLSAVAGGRNQTFNRTIAFIGWMLLLLGLIVVIGHYAAIAIVTFLLVRVVSKERLILSLILTAGLTVTIFLLFELVFDIELHRGAIGRSLFTGVDFIKGGAV